MEECIKCSLKISQAMKLSGNSKILQYGSGPVVGAVGTDNVYVPGCDDLVAKDFPILEVVAHGVVVLAAHELLTAIIGMGPGLANDMHKRLHHLLGAERFTYCFPKDVSGDGVIVWNDRDPRRRMPGSWLKPAKQIEMAGVNHWAVKLSKMTMFGGQLKNERDVGCNPSCGAILDTGTTMIAVDPVLYASVLNEWSKLNDCAQFHELPSLRFHLGNAEHILPPEAYIGVVVPCTYNPFTNACEEDESNDEALKNPNIFKMKQQHLLLNEKPLRDPTMFFSNVSPSDKKKIQLHARRTTVAANRSEKSKGRGVTCELLLMSSNFGVTQNGPMMILGMPFFRYHTTTFDVSGEKEWVRQLLAGESEDKIWPRGFNNARSRRKIFTRPAGSDCSEEQMTGKGSRPSRLSGGQHMSRRVPVYGANQLRKMFEKDTATLERHIANVAKYGW